MRLFNKLIQLLVILSFTGGLFFSCQKEFSIEDGNNIPTSLPNDLTTKVNTSVSGFVTNENDAPVLGATVKAGTKTVTTDQYGYFEIKNIQLPKNAAFVTVIKPGYFKGIKTYMAKAGKAAFFRIKLIPKIISGNINSTTGGEVTLSNGLKIGIPANGVMNANSNTPYTGNVNVSAYWINPTSSELSSIMPGDLRGINTNGKLKGLNSFGMAAVELTGSSGELLQIATGKQAALTMPIPAAILSSAPATIPLWYFNETNGLWKEEGMATKSGNSYSGSVSHFSYWNCDDPFDCVYFDCTVLDQNGHPIQSAYIKMSIISPTQWYSNAGGYTDESGYSGGLIPDSAQLLMEIFASSSCSTPVYSQTITTTNVNVSLGNVIINTADISTITGNLTNCAGGPVTNGHVVVQNGNQNFSVTVNNTTGNFLLNILNCSAGAIIHCTGIDNNNLMQGLPVTVTLTNGVNAIGPLSTCGISIPEYIIYTINGVEYSYTSPLYDFTNSLNNQAIVVSCIRLGGTVSPVSFYVSRPNIGLGSVQNLLGFRAVQITDTIPNFPASVPVNITEYGAVGNYWAGNFTCTLTGNPPANNTYAISCNFRTRRYQ